MANSSDPDQLALDQLASVCKGRVYPGSAGLGLTHCSQETHKTVTGKQCRPRSEAAESGI